jgi:5'-3' exonuclease
MEADDVVCSVMIYLNSIDTCAAICCGNDKDLLQIPGHHYNFFKNVGKEVTVKEAVYSLYNQVLCGDSADNIPGLYKCGPKGAELILGNPELDENNIHVGILHAFTSKLGVDKGIQSFYENYMLCKLRTDLSLEDRLLSSYDLDAGAVREFKPREDEVEELPSFNSDLFTVE